MIFAKNNYTAIFSGLKVVHHKSAQFAAFYSRFNIVNASNINNLGIFFTLNELINSVTTVLEKNIGIKCTLY